MTRAVRLLGEASAELEAAAQWYEERRAGLGTAFVAAVDNAVGAVGTWPGAGQRVKGVGADLEVRRARVRGFPYHLAYMAPTMSCTS